ncbi:MAG: NAD-binding protein, partial [Thiohalobacterales bacterium]|nr:NAD-binding protein [Thiohalobacterales bacterium]
IMVIMAYAISILGMVLAPGIDDQGNPWHMSFFHAFYFVSFMGSTIGFGEIPYPFSDPQRMWTTIAMYLTVISWLYAIGALFAVIQDPAFKRVLAFTTFTRAVRKMREPFYLVCGIGDAGSLVVRELTADGIRCVCLDRNDQTIQAMRLENFALAVPTLTADVTDSSMLLAAGLRHRHCAGVLALTDVDHVNLNIAISCKLLAPDLQVVCRSQLHDSAANMASFGTDYIINPFDTFAERLAMMFQSPSMFLVYEWMTSLQQAPLREFSSPPRGTWIVCGYGRFGKAVQWSLSFKGLRIVIVEADLAATGAPEGAIEGRGTEAFTLYEAGIEEAVGIIAGTDDDANNLSIIMTARNIKQDLFTVARQNLSSNDAIFAAADVDMVMQSGNLIGRRIIDLLTNPLIADFLRKATRQTEDWANVLVSRVVGILDEASPETWTITIDREQTPALYEAIMKGLDVRLGHLVTDPRCIADPLPCVALYLKRANHDERLTPENDTVLQHGDQLLFCGLPHAETHMRWTTHNYHALRHICTGEDRPVGTIWRLLSRQPSA